MASLFNFGFFGNQPHRVFNYKPRYYDPEEEKRRQMFGDVDGTNEKARENGEYVPGSSLRGGALSVMVTTRKPVPPWAKPTASSPW